MEKNGTLLATNGTLLATNGTLLATNGTLLATNGNDLATLSTDKNNKLYICEFCNKQYFERSGLWRHKQKCNPNSCCDSKMCEFCHKQYSTYSGLWKHKQKCKEKHKDANCDDSENFKTDKDVIMLLIKENSELKNMIMKVLENGTNNTSNSNIANNSNNNINNNKTFNLQVFLNETCKNAMNISEFIESLQPQLSDLESIGKLGFVEGISKIIIKGLKELDENKRPIHCTDKKRETVYIKDDDKWEKEDENKSRLRKAINDVAHENTLLIPKWKAKHPDYLDSSSASSDQYNNLIIEVLGGEGESSVNENKIIRKIAREVVIDKQ